MVRLHGCAVDLERENYINDSVGSIPSRSQQCHTEFTRASVTAPGQAVYQYQMPSFLQGSYFCTYSANDHRKDFMIIYNKK